MNQHQHREIAALTARVSRLEEGLRVAWMAMIAGAACIAALFAFVAVLL